MEKFQREYEGQIAFFKDLRIDVDVKLINNTDGIYNGNLFEFKLAQDRKNTISKCLKQSIKYLSRMRVKGEPVPKNILIIYLNQEKCYVFNANDYFEEIHEIY
jgi:penicillin-binding protein-related factor A (putative recombinase)